ncbi:hypothetical protein CY34DRAFT_14959 [Suillus luteus UH-Slu-Lm8-n1]|uniref:Small EDRK-rich factor-like N-terminal domain-containing protein n=1 Tax=Suillus luteus UH-Slu-Lm8-n1 TaxID=930992 RepID=A0A0D0A9X3_9AGAM|nr:hypothetical protein CY34DRAFT_14959 [Suillus luteus UH-Slu-Lm8-n1]
MNVLSLGTEHFFSFSNLAGSSTLCWVLFGGAQLCLTPSTTRATSTSIAIVMTRGNQRETDRAKAAKKQAALNKSKAKESNTSLAKRKEADAEILRAKQKA